jgi:mannitol-1-phosphate/altronate dehydrogenase
LKLRKERGEMPFTVLSCDNIPENGPKCQALVIELADKVDPLLGAWVREHCLFPMTMVDRITPLTSEHDRRTLAEQYHIEDAWPVVAEDYMQWVIEDKFVDGCRPTYEVGMHRYTPHVTSWEYWRECTPVGSPSRLDSHTGRSCCTTLA